MAGSHDDDPADNTADTTSRTTDDENHGSSEPAPDETDEQRDPTDEYPDYGDRVGETIAYDEIDPDEAPIYLEPSKRKTTADDPISFTLANGRSDTLHTNFWGWHIHKQIDGDWFRIAPRFTPQPLMFLDPEEAHTWTVETDNDGIDEGRPVHGSSGTADLTVSAMGGGRYAFGVTGWFDGNTYEEQVAFVATFDLTADDLSLTPTSAIIETTRDDGWLVADSDRGDPADDRQQLGAYELEQLDQPSEDGTRLITEQVLRNDQLRDTLALALEHDAPRVRLREYNGTKPIFGRADGVFQYGETAYRVSTSELDE